MRARKKKHGAERLIACSDYFIEEKPSFNGKKLYLEIGCGKGKFITENAAVHPDIQFIGVEKVSDVILVAAEKAKKMELGNVKFIMGDAKLLKEKLGENSVDLIYLNFSDPWPKSGHYKRRLTYRDFLEIYKYILKDGGAVFFKTDNRGLFDFSLGEFKENGWNVKNVTTDLHNSEYNEGNIMTEYEKNFSEKGFSICRLEAWKK